MPEYNAEIIERIIEFGQRLYGDKHGWKVEFAKGLKFNTVQQLNNILYGKAAVGAKMQAALRDLGADVDYIMTGKRKDVDTGTVQFKLHGSLPKDVAEGIRKVDERLAELSKEDPDISEKILTIINTIHRK